MKKLESLKMPKFEALSNGAMSYTVGGASVITKATWGMKSVGSSNDLSTDGGAGVGAPPGSDWEAAAPVQPPSDSTPLPPQPGDDGTIHL